MKNYLNTNFYFLLVWIFYTLDQENHIFCPYMYYLYTEKVENTLML